MIVTTPESLERKNVPAGINVKMFVSKYLQEHLDLKYIIVKRQIYVADKLERAE